MKKIGIVGFGQQTIGFIQGLIDSNKIHEFEIHIFEKSKDIFSSSISGIRQDGKLFISNSMGGDDYRILNDLNLQKKIVNLYKQFSELNDFEQTNIEHKKFQSLKKQFFKYGFQLIESKFYHIGTDVLTKFLTNIFNEYSKYPNIHFHFNNKIIDIEFNDRFNLIKEDEQVLQFDYVIIQVGRSGHNLITNLKEKFPNLIQDSHVVDLGIRYEIPNFIVEELNNELYEFKLKYKTKNGLIVRTFCNNPSGFVVTEEYEDFTTVNGHSKQYEKSNNTNFAILVTHSFTHPFKDSTQYGINIQKQQNILQGGKDKVILQTFGDFVNGKRTKKLFSVHPTLDENKFVLGDINLVIPRKTSEQILEFLYQLDFLVDGISNENNLMYQVEVKFYSNKVINTDRLKFIGDCSGWTRSIVHQSVHGYIEQMKI